MIKLTRAHWYGFRNRADHIRATQGFGPAMADAFALYIDKFHTVRSLSLETSEAMGRSALTLPVTSIYRHAMFLLMDGDKLASMTATIAALACSEPLPPCLSDIIAAGPDAGHPVWHTINQFYRAWLEAPCDPSGAQEDWARNHLHETAKPLTDDEYAAWKASPSIARDVLKELIESERPQSAIDIGCDRGMLIRFMGDLGVMPRKALWGCDFMPGRIAAAQTMLRGANMPANVICHDMLADDFSPLTAGATVFDLVTMFAISGVFPGDQFERVVRKIRATLNPKWIVSTDAFPSVPRWHARTVDELSAIYARHGYRLARHQFTGDPMEPVRAPHMVLCPKYFLAGQVEVWQRQD